MPAEENLWFDTVVLSNFVFSDCLDWMRERYPDRIHITSEVFDEITHGIAAGYDRLKEIYTSVSDGKIKLEHLTVDELTRAAFLRKYLGAGEYSCLAATRSRGGIVVTDDRRARAACRENQLRYTGTIGILAAACTGGNLSVQEADIILHRMRKYGFYSPVSSLKDIL